MATDNERMILELSAQMRQFEKAMLDAAGSADRAAQRVERRFEQMNRKVTQDFTRFRDQVTGVIAAIGVGMIARDVTQLADTWTMVGNRLAFAGVQSERLATIQNTVADIAARTRSDLDATADLFARMYRSSEDLGASLTEVAAVTEIVSKALAGAAQSERMGAIRQLGQGLGSGRLQGDELRSILENSRPIAEAIAAEFETTVGNLRELGKQGQLESRRVFQAILRAGDEIDESFARTTFTVADAFQRLRTEAARFVGTNEQTSASVKSLTALIDFVATNFESLADAVVITATVMGGAFAGVAVARTIVALSQLTLTATTAKNALNFFGGPLGIILTLAGGALAYVATQTDLLASKQDILQRASSSSYAALQQIASLNEDLAEIANEAERTASATGELSEVATAAREALDEITGASEDATEALGVQGTISVALAEQERQRTLGTLKQAGADQQATIALIRRTAAQRGLIAALDLNPRTVSSVEGALTPEERRQIAEAERLKDLFEAAVRAGEGIPIELWQQLFDLRQEGADADERGARAQGQSAAELERALELQIAQIQGREDAVRYLQQAEDIDRRTQQWIAAGTEALAARAIAESEVLAIQQAQEEAGRRNVEIMELQDQIEIARMSNNMALAQSLQDEIDLRKRAVDLARELGITQEEARARAEAWLAAVQEARAEQLSTQLEVRSMEDALEIARARGDDRAEEAIRRRLELEQRISELRRLGLTEEAATARAEMEVAALERADLQGRFREWFKNGAMAAFDGDFGEFFENWLRERASAAMEDALNSVADFLFDIGQQMLGDLSRGGGPWSEILSEMGKGSSGWNEQLAEAANEVAANLRDALGASATEAATKIAISSAASAASAVKETAAATAKQSAAAQEIAQMISVARAASAAAAALNSLAAAGGGSAGGGLVSGLLGSFLNGFGGGASSGLGSFMNGGASFPFGGFFDKGGPINPGNAYVVHRDEVIVPRVPSFVVPKGGVGGGGSQYVDARQFVFNGTSDELREELLGILAQDYQQRRAQTFVMVNDGLDRRMVGR